MTMRLLLALLLSAALLATALSAGGCSSDQGVDHLSFDQALTYDSDTPVTLTGSLLIEGGRARFCDGLAESNPPQCGARRLDVVSLPRELPDMEESSDGRVKWIEQVTVMGVVSGGEIAIGHFVD
jgi:hypothetical protein